MVRTAGDKAEVRVLLEERDAPKKRLGAKAAIGKVEGCGSVGDGERIEDQEREIAGSVINRIANSACYTISEHINELIPLE